LVDVLNTIIFNYDFPRQRWLSERASV